MKTKKYLLIISMACVWLILPFTAHGQVKIGEEVLPTPGAVLDLNKTIGTSDYYLGGLLLPNVVITDLGLIPATFTEAGGDDVNLNLAGLIVYNTNVNAAKNIKAGIHIWDGNDWKLMNLDGGSMTISPKPVPVFPKEGDDKEITVTNPGCDMPGNYLFNVIAGDATVTPDSSSDGIFTVTFDANPFAVNRKAVVLVTDPCGNSATFIFEQDADDTLCSSTVSTPTISVNGGGAATLCAGGSVFLYLNGTVNGTPSEYIWTKNGLAVGHGRFYEAKSAGTYIVYYGAIGCENNKASITITSSGSYTGNKVDVLVDGNNGYVCSSGDTTPLIAVVSDPADVTKIRWFKDGVLQTGGSFDGQKQIAAGIGQWQVALKDGGCFSEGSRVVTVQLSPDSATPAPGNFGITVLSSMCKGGNIIANVNAGDVVPTLIYTWYANTTLLKSGVGVSSIAMPIPAEINSLAVGADVHIRCMAKTPGSCSKETISSKTLQAGASVPKAIINSSTDGIICDGSTTLIVTNNGGKTVKWYDSAISTSAVHTGASYTVTAANTVVYAEIWDGTCVGERASFKTGNASNISVVNWKNAPATSSVNRTETYAVDGYNLDGATYAWSVTDGGVISGSGASVSITFKAESLTTVVSVVVTNACGPAVALTQTVDVNAACDPVASVTISGPASVYSGVSFTLTANPVGGNNVQYKWYKGAADTGETGKTATFTETTSATYTVKAWSLCDTEAGAATGTHAVTIAAHPSTNTPAPAGAILTGVTCYDVVMDNDGGCGLKSTRTQHDFATTTSAAYTFKPASGTVTDVQFVAINNNTIKPVVLSLTNDNHTPVTAAAGCTVTVNFVTTLNNDAKGLTSAQALTADLYVTYKISTTTYYKKLTISVQDCACCGANINAGWKTFMCHNLGATMTADPFTASAAIHGAKYKFGNFSPVVDQATDQNHSYDAAGWVGLWSTMSPPQADGHWDLSNTTDPCKNTTYGGGPGWRLPTQDEWGQVLKAANGNTISRTSSIWGNDHYNFDSGIFLGPNLFLPAAGYRLHSDGRLTSRGSGGYYWSSTQQSGSGGYNLRFYGTSSPDVPNTNRSYGFTVRCIAEF